MNKQALKNKLIEVLREQGFKINPHVRPAGYSKTTYRRIQQKARLEQLSKHKDFLADSIQEIKDYCRNGFEIIPEKVSLELNEIFVMGYCT